MAKSFYEEALLVWKKAKGMEMVLAGTLNNLALVLDAQVIFCMCYCDASTQLELHRETLNRLGALGYNRVI